MLMMSKDIGLVLWAKLSNYLGENVCDHYFQLVQFLIPCRFGFVKTLISEMKSDRYFNVLAAKFDKSSILTDSNYCISVVFQLLLHNVETR